MLDKKYTAGLHPHSRAEFEEKELQGWRKSPRGARLTLLKICKPSWPPDTYILPSKTVTPAALRFELIGVTTVHLQKQWKEQGHEIRCPGLPRQPSREQADISVFLYPDSFTSHFSRHPCREHCLLLGLSPEVSGPQPVSTAPEISTLKQDLPHAAATAVHSLALLMSPPPTWLSHL